MYRRKHRSEQGTLWIPTHDLPQASSASFYGRLHARLESMGFGDHVRKLCAPYYDDSGRGHPGTDPEVFFRMFMVGFFENLGSERAIAERCDDSRKIRAFLGYALTERTPDHSTLCRFRKRIPEEVFYGVFDHILKALKKAGLLKGNNLGIDSSVVEANASLASLQDRLSKEGYAEYVKRLAQEEGVDVDDPAAVRKFDKNREGRKTSNKEWENPHDEDARIARTKRGNTRMAYKPEHVVDLESGAIVDAKLRHGDEGDATNLFTRVAEAETRLSRVFEKTNDSAAVKTITADKGYYSTDEIWHLQDAGVLTIIPEAKRERNLDKLCTQRRTAITVAEALCRSEEGKAFSRRRAALVERSFAHVLDAGGLRRTTLRGKQNINKRYVIGALTFNLSLLMRKLYGVGTPKQAFAKRLAALIDLLLRNWREFHQLVWPGWPIWAVLFPEWRSSEPVRDRLLHNVEIGIRSTAS